MHGHLFSGHFWTSTKNNAQVWENMYTPYVCCTCMRMLAKILKITGLRTQEKTCVEIPLIKHCLTAPHHWYGTVLEQKRWLEKCLKSINNNVFCAKIMSFRQKLHRLAENQIFYGKILHLLATNIVFPAKNLASLVCFYDLRRGWFE